MRCPNCGGLMGFALTDHLQRTYYECRHILTTGGLLGSNPTSDLCYTVVRNDGYRVKPDDSILPAGRKTGSAVQHFALARTN